MSGRTRLAAALAVALVLAPPAGAALLASGGAARMPIVLADDATAPEETAAAELAHYLGEVASAAFVVVRERDVAPGSAGIYVGPTRAAAAAGIDAATLGEEAWRVRVRPRSVIVAGGRPRGTLYAAYHLLEDDVGVRWWNAFEESVPRRGRLRLREGLRSGEPAFAHRDVSGLDGPVAFRARNRLNGHHVRLPLRLGGYQAFGSPWFVHSFFDAFPPDRDFEAHPEFYSERSGFRVADRSQLCLTNPELRERAARLLAEQIQASDARTAEVGAPRLKYYDLSQNDWGRPCRCERCRAALEREGSDSGPLLDFLNDVAGRLATPYPHVLLTTLAYTYTFEPPRHVRARDNVVVRLTGYGRRDVSRPVTDPANRRFRDAVLAWRTVAKHLWIWDYAVVFFGNDRNMPIPSHRHYAEDFRFYREAGVEGIFVQHEFPIASDLRDLKLWLYVKLMEDPGRSQEALERDFLEGYYGRAAPWVRRYLATLAAAADRHPGYVGAESDPDAFGHLDARFFAEGFRLFDRAEASVAGDPVLSRRVRHARLSLDYAALWFWPAARDAVPAGRDEIAERYRRTWREQIDLRVEPERREEARRALDEEVRQILSW